MLIFGNLVVILALLASSSFAMMPPSATEYYAESLVDAQAAFDKWAKDNGKTYTSELEEKYRYLIWRKTLDDVVAWNTDMQTDAGYYKGMTWFADYTQEEYTTTLCSFSLKDETISSPSFQLNRVSVGAGPENGNRTAPPPPASVDWRAAGVVGNVKYQQNCGACWAFGPVAAVESAFALKNPISGPPDLAEQELLDCAPGSKNDNGCEGNFEGNAYNTIVSRGGISLEQDYPYFSGETGVDGACRTFAENSTRPVVNIDGFAYDDSVDEETILQWAAFQPVVVAVDATEWKDYRGGIYDGPCSSSNADVNHAVVIVGFGEENGVPYYIIRNSWGETWGEEGYMRLRRGVGGNGRCGVHSRVSFPVYCGWNAKCVDLQGERRPVEAVFPPLQPGLPLPVDLDTAEKKFREGSTGPGVVVEYGEYESGIIAAFDKEFGSVTEQ